MQVLLDSERGPILVELDGSRLGVLEDATGRLVEGLAAHVFRFSG